MPLRARTALTDTMSAFYVVNVDVPLTFLQFCRKGEAMNAIEPDRTNAIKKNVLVPRCVIRAIDGHAFLWTVNASPEPVALPAGLKLATFEEQTAIDIRMVAESSGISRTTPNYSAKLRRMINKSLSSSEQHVLEGVPARYVEV